MILIVNGRKQNIYFFGATGQNNITRRKRKEPFTDTFIKTLQIKNY